MSSDDNSAGDKDLQKYESDKECKPLKWKAAKVFQTIVDLFLSSGKVVIEEAFLKEHPLEANLEFYKFIGQSAKRLAIMETLEQDLRPLLSCFPHLRELNLRRVIISHHAIEGFPVKLNKLTIIKCLFHRSFLEKWFAGLSRTLDSLSLICGIEKLHLPFDGTQFAGDLDFPKLKKLYIAADKKTIEIVDKINCPSLEYFWLDVSNRELLDTTIGALDGSTKMLTTLILRNCPDKQIGLFDRLPNLKHLTILNTIEDTEKWSKVKKLEFHLETFKCSFTAAPLDILPDEKLIEIIGYLDTEDYIALTHVNRRFREILLDHIYPRREIQLRPDFQRYPMKKCHEIYSAIAQRATKLLAKGKGTVEIAKLSFPNLKSLRVEESKLDSFDGIPNGLQLLHLDQCFVVPLNLILNKVRPTLQDLILPSDELVGFAGPNLRKLKSSAVPSVLESILDDNPKLQELDISVKDHPNGTSINIRLLKAFNRRPGLAILKINFTSWTVPLSTYLEHLDVSILPNLKELTIQHKHPDQNNLVRRFLQSISTSELKKLKINEFFDEIKLFKGLESLHVVQGLGIEITMDTLKALPELLDITGHNPMSFSDGIDLVTFLASAGRQLTFNGKRLAFKPFEADVKLENNLTLMNE